MKALLTAIATVVLLSACANKYTPPKDGPVASVTYRAAANVKQAALFSYDQEDCQNPKFLGAVGSSTQGNLATLTGKEEPITPEKTFAVPATGKFINLFRLTAASGLYQTAHCFLTIGFVPAPGQTYEALIQSDSASCSAQVFKVDSATGRKILEPSAQRTAQQCRF